MIMNYFKMSQITIFVSTIDCSYCIIPFYLVLCDENYDLKGLC